MKGLSPSQKKRLSTLAAAVFWLLLWQAASMAIGHEILLASPVSVVYRLFTLLPEGEFWKALLFSVSRITLGFFLAFLSGTLLSMLSSRFSLMKALISPFVGVIRATPVASFIILVLLWLPSRRLSLFISFLMATPIFYSNVLTGLENLDRRLLEMAQVFEVSPRRRFRFLYLPQLLPYFRSASAIALGLCWKSGVAAEVIGLPQGSIGERLYQAKIYLETPELLAWTLLIILISILSEKLFLKLFDLIIRRVVSC